MILSTVLEFRFAQPETISIRAKRTHKIFTDFRAHFSSEYDEKTVKNLKEELCEKYSDDRKMV